MLMRRSISNLHLLTLLCCSAAKELHNWPHFKHKSIKRATTKIMETSRFIVRLCHESHRDAVERHVVSRHDDRNATQFTGRISRHFRHLKSLPAFAVSFVVFLLPV